MVNYLQRWLAAFTSPLPLIAFAGASAAGALTLDWIDAAYGALLAAVVLYVAVADLDRFEIPDIASLIILILGLAWTAKDSEFYSAAVLEAFIRSLLCGGLFLAVRVVYRTLRDAEGLGLGDVKLAGAGASWLSWSHTIVALALAVGAAVTLVVVGSLVTRQRIHAQVAIPFGAFLAPAIWVAWFAEVRGF